MVIELLGAKETASVEGLAKEDVIMTINAEEPVLGYSHDDYLRDMAKEEVLEEVIAKEESVEGLTQE